MRYSSFLKWSPHVHCTQDFFCWTSDLCKSANVTQTNFCKVAIIFSENSCSWTPSTKQNLQRLTFYGHGLHGKPVSDFRPEGGPGILEIFLCNNLQPLIIRLSFGNSISNILQPWKLDTPARLVIRLSFGFVSDSVFAKLNKTEYKH